MYGGVCGMHQWYREVYKYFGYSRIVYKLVVLWKGGASLYIMDAC